ncbi:tetratricopeptide repeat protein [Mycobacterium sp. AZCC_0083]|uniref:tetratricopeptide repeat protein n=1 Tax=Mycobacterium sp. AZCC_0083 TaxID=2735882 RepID=UPI00160B2A72|nr:tetratricopeptide repeat protein [Mycobacterium sp. AZCC_0083]MBB5165780.1 Flp pilus assembly protein TadD [Mycobacterium sp. AZCC_0083]
MIAAFDDIDAVVRAAESYMAAGDFRGAESVVGTALGAHPNHPRLLTVYARVKLGQSDYVAAASSAHAALSVAPEDEYAMRVYSHALELQGRIPEALTMAWQTATAHPQSNLAHHTYARMLSDAGRPVEAMTAINEALRLNPNDADAFNLRGDIRVALGEVDAAEADYRHALQLNPMDASVVHNLATLEYQRRRRWSAVRGFVVAERLDPRFGDVVRRNVGVVLTGVLRRSAWLVLIVTIAVVATYNMRDDGATVIPRVVAGVGAVLLVAMSIPVLRNVPGPMLTSVLRQRQILAVRILQLLAAVVLGALTAVAGALTVPGVAASFLLLSVPVVAMVGAITGERLW